MFDIHCEDAMNVMAEMEDGSVDLAVFDPPYPTISGGSNEGGGGDWDRPGGLLTPNDGKIFAINDIDPDVYLPEVYRVLADQSHCYMMCNLLGLRGGIMETVQRHGFQVHNLLSWVKNNVTPSRFYMKNLEYTLFLRKGPAFTINNRGSKTGIEIYPHPLDFEAPLDWDNVRSPKPHPTAKPVNLMRTYIENSSKVGDMVFDPFMGAGSTGVAALELGRRFIGVEMEPEYFDIAEQRLNDFTPRRTLTESDLEII
jgi:DNA modification methylase